ncbi:hypothetical protein [Niabella beijingensis]|uniref:hypothetical protein n=1 Tax=Niabella beijingensis TaxID=2872700 RepID=UPI001CBA9D31|nr:hypothetical protein [Niabella beijingensis]MBZ4191417.1 hypothetical protein [Niabella beijingensis]
MKQCSDEAPVAVFIASHFVTAFERLVYGTHAVAIAKHSPVPVIVIPPAGGMNRLDRAGIAIDLLGTEAMPWKLLRNWLKLFGPKLDLVYISSNPDGVSQELPLAVEAAGQLSDFEWDYCFITNDSAVGGLEEYVRLYQPDLPVLFAGRHGLFHKSISGLFITAPPVPVMLLSAEIEDFGERGTLS